MSLMKFDFGDRDCDDPQSVAAFPRMDSSEVLYQPRKKVLGIAGTMI